MKQCPYCAEDIQDAAIVCKHCGRDLGGSAPTVLSEPKAKPSRIVRWGGGFILAMIALGVIGSIVSPTSPSSSTAAPSGSVAASSAGPSLALISSRGYESDGGGFHIVEGEIKNLTSEPLRNVTAVASWYAQDGTFIKSDEAIVEFNPIMPGQTSPFKTMSSGNPQMSKFSVVFKDLLGPTINTRDDRKR